MAKAKTKDNRGDPVAKPETAEDPNKPIQAATCALPEHGTFRVRTYGAHLDIDGPSSEAVQKLLKRALAEIEKTPGSKVEIVT